MNPANTDLDAFNSLICCICSDDRLAGSSWQLVYPISRRGVPS